MWSYNHTEKYVYDFSLLPEIKIADYSELTETVAAKRITDKMQMILNAAIAENEKHYVTNRDK